MWEKRSIYIYINKYIEEKLLSRVTHKGWDLSEEFILLVSDPYIHDPLQL